MPWRIMNEEEFLSNANGRAEYIAYINRGEIIDVHGIQNRNMIRYNMYGMLLSVLLQESTSMVTPEDTLDGWERNTFNARVYSDDGNYTSYEFHKDMFIWEYEMFCILKRHDGITKGQLVIRDGIGHIVEDVAKTSDGTYLVLCEDGERINFGEFQAIHKSTINKIL